MDKKHFRLVIEVETENEQLDWATIDDYVKQKFEDDGELAITDITVKEL